MTMTATGSLFPVFSLDRRVSCWEDYLDVQTPIEEFEGLRVKRDDYFAPLGPGGINGGKVRQLVWLLARYRHEQEASGRAQGVLMGGSVKSPNLARFLNDPADDMAEMFPRRTTYKNSFFWVVAIPLYRPLNPIPLAREVMVRFATATLAPTIAVLPMRVDQALYVPFCLNLQRLLLRCRHIPRVAQASVQLLRSSQCLIQSLFLCHASPSVKCPDRSCLPCGPAMRGRAG